MAPGPEPGDLNRLANHLQNDGRAYYNGYEIRTCVIDGEVEICSGDMVLTGPEALDVPDSQQYQDLQDVAWEAKNTLGQAQMANAHIKQVKSDTVGIRAAIKYMGFLSLFILVGITFIGFFIQPADSATVGVKIETASMILILALMIFAWGLVMGVVPIPFLGLVLAVMFSPEIYLWLLDYLNLAQTGFTEILFYVLFVWGYMIGFLGLLGVFLGMWNANKSEPK